MRVSLVLRQGFADAKLVQKLHEGLVGLSVDLGEANGSQA